MHVPSQESQGGCLRLGLLGRGRQLMMRTLSLVVVIPGLLVWSGCGKPPPPPPAEKADYGSIRDQVVHQITTGQIKLSDSGVGLLTPEFESASINGQVIAGQTPATGWVVAFPLQQGRAAMQCLVYVEKKAPPAGQKLQLGTLAVTIGNQASGRWYQGVLAAK
jgi:hypothetical protein